NGGFGYEGLRTDRRAARGQHGGDQARSLLHRRPRRRLARYRRAGDGDGGGVRHRDSRRGCRTHPDDRGRHRLSQGEARGVKSSPSRPVVITGVGCGTRLGIGVAATWNAPIAGKSGVRRIERFDAGEFPSQIAGEVPGELDLSDVPAKEARRIDRSIALALVASREALESSKLTI